MRIFLLLILLSVTFLSNGVCEEKTGKIIGQVYESKTQQPLIGVNIIIVEKPRIGAVSDINGNFEINLPVGEYSIRLSSIGYQTVVRTDIVVSTGRSTKIKVLMEESAIELKGVEATTDYFNKAGSINIVSTIGLNQEEIRRSPGSAQDMQRIIQAMPSVANSSDQTNELIVRGGAPNENLTVMDNIEIPSTNHYPNQMNSGGPINMVNVDLIEDIKFSTGGFSAQYGDKLSSVLDITIREGDRQKYFASNSGLSFAGFQSVMEGKLGDEGHGSWVVSLRRSFLESLNDLMGGLNFIGLTAVPKYWDSQFKIVYDFSSAQKFTLSGIYGNDKIFIDGESDKIYPAKANTVDSVGKYRVDVASQQYAWGMSLKSLWSKNAYSILTIAGIGNHYYDNVQEDFTQRIFDGNGKPSKTNLLNNRQIAYNNSTESTIDFKIDALYIFNDQHELNTGAALKLSNEFSSDSHWYSDTMRYDLNGDGVFETGPVVTKGGNVIKDIGLAKEYKTYFYANDKLTLIPNLIINLGLRYDYFSYSDKGNVSPRVSLSYNIFSPNTTINAAYGEFYQVQSLPLYSNAQNTDINRYLRNSHATHFVLGVEQILGPGLKASIEGYYKRYNDLPVSENFIHSDDKTFRSELITNIGEQYSKGIEFFIQQKLVKDYYGTISFSKSTTQFKDCRLNPKSEYFPSDYDFPTLFTLIFGKRVKGVRSWLDNSLSILKYPSKILPFSDDMEVSFRWRFSSGRPYTPRIFVATEQYRQGGIKWSQGAWVDSDDYNSARYPDFHRLDINWLSRYHMEGWNIVVYFSIQNVYARQNIASYQYNSDGSVENVYQFGFFPVGGVDIEF